MTGYTQTVKVCIEPLPDRFLFNQKEFHKDKNNCFEATLDPNKENFMEVFKSGYNTQRRYLTTPSGSKLEFQLTRTYYNSELNMEFILSKHLHNFNKKIFIQNYIEEKNKLKLNY